MKKTEPRSMLQISVRPGIGHGYYMVMKAQSADKVSAKSRETSLCVVSNSNDHYNTFTI